MKIKNKILMAFSTEVKKVPTEIHVVPIGEWKEREFRIVKEDCEDIITNFEEFGIDLVIDYEHQSLNSAWNGAPAPAAGWIHKLELREDGIWATEVSWTEEAKELIEGGKYKYVSPVIQFNDHDRHDDSWIGASLHSVALTNTPYFRDDLHAFRKKNNNVAPEDSAEKEKETQMEKLKKEIEELKQGSAEKDLQIEELTKQVAAKDAELAELEVVKKVDDAIAAKKLLPAHRETAIFMAKQGEETLGKFMASVPTTDLTQSIHIPEQTKNEAEGDPKERYFELLKDPAKLEKFKKEHPEEFNKLRDKALYGGK